MHIEHIMFSKFHNKLERDKMKEETREKKHRIYLDSSIFAKKTKTSKKGVAKTSFPFPQMFSVHI